MLTPNPRFLFLSKTHNEVYAHLVYGIENKVGFVEVTGEVGTGKTTVLRTLLAHLKEDKYRVAFIFNPKLTAFELLKNINREFGVNNDADNNPDLINALNEFLLNENQAGRIPVLVIDEAQNLSGEVLEQIRLISNLETEAEKLIQIVLVGQPELRHHLSDYSLRQLNQRIAVRYQLQPLNMEETISYIHHRLNVAGRSDGNLFSQQALKTVYKYSNGVPRKINLICDRALLTTYSEERSVVSAQDVKQAVGELAGLNDDTPDSLPFAWTVSAVVVALVILLAGFFWLDPFHIQPVEAKNELEKAPVETQVSSVPQPGPESVSPVHSLVASSNALFSLWGAPLVPSNVTDEQFNFDREFGLRGFKLLRRAGSIDTVARLNLPFLVPLAQSTDGEYLAVVGQDNQTGLWRVEPPLLGQRSVSSRQIAQASDGTYLLPWSDFASIGSITVPGIKGENVRRLQYLLGLIGCANVSASGRYDEPTVACVKNFQDANTLTVDGLVGPETLILLYQAAGAYDMPRLGS